MTCSKFSDVEICVKFQIYIAVPYLFDEASNLK